jgi:hypothetical protein
MNGASSASAGMTASFEGRRYTEPFHPSRRFLASFADECGIVR